MVGARGYSCQVGNRLTTQCDFGDLFLEALLLTSLKEGIEKEAWEQDLRCRLSAMVEHDEGAQMEEALGPKGVL